MQSRPLVPAPRTQDTAGDIGEPPWQVAMPKPKPKRTTCDSCRDRKVRCDREHPVCSRCKRLKIDCRYATSEIPPGQLDLMWHQMHSRLLRAETDLRNERQSNQRNSQPYTGGSSPQVNSEWPTEPIVSSTTTDADRALTKTTGEDLFDFNNLPVSSMDADVFAPMDLTMDPAMVDFQAPLSDYMMSITDSDPSRPWTVTSSSHSPHSHDSDAPFSGNSADPSPDQLARLHRAYFDHVAPRYPFIDMDPARSQHVRPTTGQITALSYAIAAIGASTNPADASLEYKCYTLARSRMDEIERQGTDTATSDLRVAQALILLARHEFQKVSPITALLTCTKAMRLLTLFGCHLIKPDMKLPGRASRLLPSSSGLDESLMTKEMMRTWWAAYVLDCRFAATDDFNQTVPPNEVTTPLPQPTPATSQYPIAGLRHFEKPYPGLVTPASAFVMALKLTVDTMAHRQKGMDMEQIESYNFCYFHDKIEKNIQHVVDAFPYRLPPNFTPQEHGDIILLDFAHIICFGLRISLHNLAISKATDLPFMETLVDKSWDVCLKTAETMADYLIRTGLTDATEIAKRLDIALFLSHPLTFAIQILLEATRDRANGRTVSLSEDKVIKSLTAIHATMKGLPNHEPEVSSALRECERVLSTTVTPSLSTDCAVGADTMTGLGPGPDMTQQWFGGCGALWAGSDAPLTAL